MVRQLFAHLSQVSEVVLLTSHGGSSERNDEGLLRSSWKGLVGYLLWLLGRLPKEAKKRPGAVFLSSGALVGGWVQFMNLWLRRPHVVVVYGTDITYRNWFYQRSLRVFLPRATLLVAISQSTRQEVLRRKLAEPGRVVVLPPGVDPEMTTREVSGLPVTDLPVMLFVGRVIPRKGIGPFIEHCLPMILEQAPAELWVVGGEAASSLVHSSGELARIHEWLGERPEEKRVRFFGEVDDAVLRAAFSRARVMILPAVPVPGDVEGFGIVFLEAALFGVPAVATSLGGIPDAVQDGVTGILVEPEDWKGFAEAVIRLLEDQRLHAQMSEAARARARERFAWPVLALQWESLLRATAGFEE